MKKMKKKGVFILVIMLWMMLVVVVVVGKADDEEAPNNIEPRHDPTPTPTSYSFWEELRKMINGACTYLFPPKIDFRAGKPVEDGGVSVNGNGGNVKEALTKSFEMTKQTVEDSAKAAAETLQQPHSEL